MYVLACLLYARNNINNLTTCNAVHRYPTRNNSNIYIHACKYSVTQNSFQYISLQLSSSLSSDIRNLSLQAFRRTVQSALKINPLYKIEEFYAIRI